MFWLNARNCIWSDNAVSGNTASGNTASGNGVGEYFFGAGEGLETISEEISAFQQYMDALPSKIAQFGIKFALALLILFIGSKLIKLVRKILRRSLERMNAEAGVIQFLDSLARALLYLVLVCWIASYFGFETTSLIAIIGSAGAAIALALQGSLSNFTGGVLILLLKPFKVGDYIIEDNKNNEGTVTEIELFYTKLRTIDDKVVVLPNGTLANTSLTNVSQSPVRCLIVTVGISYDADVKKAKEVIRNMIENEKRIMKSKDVNVYVDSLGSREVVVGYRCYVKNEEYWQVRWDMIERTKEEFDKNGIEIPFSQICVHMK